MALVVGQQLHPSWRLWVLQGCPANKWLLGRFQGSLVDSRIGVLLWTCRPQWALWLWRAVLELCRYHSAAFKWCYFNHSRQQQNNNGKHYSLQCNHRNDFIHDRHYDHGTYIKL